MTEKEALQALKEKGSLYSPEDGYHFKGISGSHLSGYCNIDPVLPFPRLLSRMTEAIIEPFKDDEVETVFVPATGAIPLAEWGPYHLEKKTGSEVLDVWDEVDCPLCKKKVPMVVDIGHGDDFVGEHPDYPAVRVLSGKR